jgi:hypothetical protein
MFLFLAGEENEKKASWSGSLLGRGLKAFGLIIVISRG